MQASELNLCAALDVRAVSGAVWTPCAAKRHSLACAGRRLNTHVKYTRNHSAFAHNEGVMLVLLCAVHWRQQCGSTGGAF